MYSPHIVLNPPGGLWSVTGGCLSWGPSYMMQLTCVPLCVSIVWCSSPSLPAPFIYPAFLCLFPTSCSSPSPVSLSHLIFTLSHDWHNSSPSPHNWCAPNRPDHLPSSYLSLYLLSPDHYGPGPSDPPSIFCGSPSCVHNPVEMSFLLRTFWFFPLLYVFGVPNPNLRFANKIKICEATLITLSIKWKP